MIDNKLMTVGELAAKMGITVRTLQYYDKEGVLKPSEQSTGGRRLYSNKDSIKLHQILAMKYLGFSLEDIKNRIIPMDTPSQVMHVLEEQTEIIKEKILQLQEVLSSLELLHQEIKHINHVDFNKYADIITLLREKNQNYWIIKFFDNETIEHIKDAFTQRAADEISQKWSSLCDDIGVLILQGEGPESSKGQVVAKEWWDMVMAFTGGDIKMLEGLFRLNNNKDMWDQNLKERQLGVDTFIGKALEIYFKNMGIQMPCIGEELK